MNNTNPAHGPRGPFALSISGAKFLRADLRS
jgi:hypothetical protein